MYIRSLHPFWCLEYNNQGRRKHGRTRGHQLARALLDKKRAQKNHPGEPLLNASQWVK